MNDYINNNGYYGEYCTPVDNNVLDNAILDDATLFSAAFNDDGFNDDGFNDDGFNNDMSNSDGFNNDMSNSDMSNSDGLNDPTEFTRWWDINTAHSLYDIIHGIDEFSISSDESSDSTDSTFITTPIKYDNGIDPATNTNIARGTDKYDVVTFYSRGKAIYGMTTMLGVSPSAYNLYRWKKGLDALFGDVN